uniref:Uncharacterized protein n=1 Tax=Spongospora subterranea TaxID=70186 RepID=A0A0H5R586_9EUKA|eukprot:CRZ09056.1 hypothetical protein [Spongospora subterranea]
MTSSCLVDVSDANDGITSQHLLMSKWTLWFDSPSGSKTQAAQWTSNIKEVFTFETVEDFWRLFNNVKVPSQIQVNSNYHLFRQGIQPAWEDPANAKGGRWKVEIKTPAEFDNLWRLMTAAIVGENFDHSEHVCGVVANPRKSFQRIGVWLKDAHDEEAIMSIGRALKAAVKHDATWDFEAHHKNAPTRSV